MTDTQKLIRRHDRIRAVWQRTKSANTAERCRLRMASIAREAREDLDRTITAWLGVRNFPPAIRGRHTKQQT